MFFFFFLMILIFFFFFFFQAEDGIRDGHVTGVQTCALPISASTPITKVEPGHPDKRLFGVVPNYRTVDAAIPFQPLTPRQKLTIASHDSFEDRKSVRVGKECRYGWSTYHEKERV